VHVVPVFGERGALLEHKIFNLFYNWPLTIRYRMHKRREFRATLQPRYGHMVVCALAATGIFVVVDLLSMQQSGELPGLNEIWGFALVVPLLCGTAVTLGAGGAVIWKRIIGAALCGIAMGICSTVISAGIGADNTIGISVIAINCIWRAFVFTIISVLGVMVTELTLPEPKAG
jgi:hypothetical protein